MVTTSTETSFRTLVPLDTPPTETIVMPAQTTTVTVAMPSATRLAAKPAPQVLSGADNPHIGRTTEVIKIVEETSTPTAFETAKPVETVWMEAGARGDGYERQFVAVDGEEEYEKGDEYEGPIRKVRRVRKPGVRMPNPPPKKKWAW